MQKKADKLQTEKDICTLTSVSQIGVGSDVKKNALDFDNAAFHDDSCHSVGEVSTVDAEGVPDKFRGLSMNEVLIRSQQPLWSTVRQCIYGLIFLLWAGLMVTMIVIALVHPKCRSQPQTSWWQGAVYYRVYVPIFKDSNGDCKGDLRGVISKLDYLKDIGVDAVSLSPIYPEDKKDVEFSITNHTAVDNQYGNIQDLVTLIQAVHKKGMYLVLDYIPNMTGKQHKWFQESQISSGRNRQNFYVWVDGTNEPNNWRSQTNGSAWSLSSKKNQTFLHQVDPSLPDLNLRSSLVLDELNEILRYWMSLGVDGFNLRHQGLLIEDYDLRDEPKAGPAVTNLDSYDDLDHKYTLNLPENFHLLRLWSNLVNKFDNNNTRILVTGMDSTREDIAWYKYAYGSADDFPRPFIIYWGPPKPCSGSCMKTYIGVKLREVTMKNSVIWMLGNDMISRLQTRLNKNLREQEVLTMLTFLLPGSVILYNGDEISMPDVSMAKNTWNAVSPNKPWRSRMMWNKSPPSAGFSDSSCTSIPSVGQNLTIAVKDQLSSATSMLNFIRNLTRLRKDPGFHVGDFQFGLVDDEVFSFVRGFDGTNCFLVAVNLSNKKQTRNFALGPGGVSSDAKVRLVTPSSSTNEQIPVGEDIDTTSLSLEGHQGIVVVWNCGLRKS